MKFGSLIDYKLLESESALLYFSPLLKKKIRKSFGLLEGPASSCNVYDGEVSYKVFLCGKTGMGKTSIASKLSGKQMSEVNSETVGLQVTQCFWPVRVIETNKTVLFKISFWDVGESVLNLYHHILPSCLQDADCILYMFSLVSKPSWEDIPKLVTRIDAEEEILKICVGTKLDVKKEVEVTNNMITDFEQVWKFPILKIANIKTTSSHQPLDQFKEISLFMNNLCELLWYRDQVQAGLIQRAAIDYCFTDNFEPCSSAPTISTFSRINGESKVTFC